MSGVRVSRVVFGYLHHLHTESFQVRPPGSTCARIAQDHYPSFGHTADQFGGEIQGESGIHHHPYGLSSTGLLSRREGRVIESCRAGSNHDNVTPRTHLMDSSATLLSRYPTSMAGLGRDA